MNECERNLELRAAVRWWFTMERTPMVHLLAEKKGFICFWARTCFWTAIRFSLRGVIIIYGMTNGKSFYVVQMQVLAQKHITP